MERELKVAILDLYDGYPNEGMRCIKMLINQFFEVNKIKGSFDVFNVRAQQELPKLSDYSIFISTGGPGSPFLEGKQWEKNYFLFFDSLMNHNSLSENKKHLFLICHSFQMMVQHLDLGLVCKRKSTSFGVLPIHKSKEAFDEPLFQGLQDPYWAVDSREYQVIQPNLKKLKELGGEILALEKIRLHIPLERAVMGIRLSDEIVGFQFHPEADAEGMNRYFKQSEKRLAVVTEHGESKYQDMIDHLEDPDKILLTESVIIPKFLKHASKKIMNFENV